MSIDNASVVATTSSAADGCREVSATAAVTSEPTAKDIGLFIADYAAWLCGCGATCIRLEKGVNRISEALGVDTDMSIMPTHIQTTVSTRDRGESFSIVRKIHKSAVSFDINTQMSKLSWDIAEGRCDFREALARFERIKLTRPARPLLVLLLVSAANASFCRLFGGDAVSMLIVFVSTLCGYKMKQVMLEDGVDSRVVFICSSFFSAVISASGHLFGWGATPEIAFASSVLYLIPGIPYINSVSDMLDGHYLCAFSRLMDGLVLTACLSLGFCGGLLLMNLNWF